MTMCGWQDFYMAAALETDWVKMPERIKTAESEIHRRHRVLSEDHGGTPEEQRALANALDGLKVLRNDVASWQNWQAGASNAETLPCEPS